MTQGLYIWSKTAATNASVDSSINYSEGQAPSTINDSARAAMARLAEYRDDISATITTGGTSTALTLTSNQVFSTLALMNGAMVAFVPNVTTGGTVTLNVDGLGAKPLRSSPGAELPVGALILGAPYVATYNNSDGAWYLQGYQDTDIWVVAGGTANAITATYSPVVSALSDGLICCFRASAANSTTTPTFAPNGLTAHTITRGGGSALQVNDIPAALAEVILRYNLANTRWELLNPTNPPVVHPTAATRQTLTSGSAATYTTPAGCTQLRVRMIGGGGGGGANTGGNNNAGTGGTTSFSTFTAVGGTGGGLAGAAGGTGGTGGSGSSNYRVAGGAGTTGLTASSSSPGGVGGAGAFGGSAAGVNGAGGAAAANTGGGGGGAGATGGGISGGGGGAGEYLEAFINSPAATYTYTVGAAGSGATGGATGGAGGSGVIIVDETYL